MSDVGSLPESPNSSSVPLAASSTENDERYLQQQRKENGRLNTLLRVPSADEYIIPGKHIVVDLIGLLIVSVSNGVHILLCDYQLLGSQPYLHNYIYNSASCF